MMRKNIILSDEEKTQSITFWVDWNKLINRLVKIG